MMKDSWTGTGERDRDIDRDRTGKGKYIEIGTVAGNRDRDRKGTMD